MRRVPFVVRLAAVATFLAFTGFARGATLYVANNGVDVVGCGAKASPCRSISQAIANAVAGDKIIVGPGRYGDLQLNGVLGETGEETPAPGCGCMLALNKAVSLTSSDGAAATMIDGRFLSVGATVLIITDGGEFGKPGKGFTVTDPNGAGDGIVLDANNVTVAGNQLVSRSDDVGSYGIETVASGGVVLIQGNQAIGPWHSGIVVRGSGKTVRANVVSGSSSYGIVAEGNSSIVGNVITGNSNGLYLVESASAQGNAVHGNKESGIVVFGPAFAGSVEGNNLFGNRVCGLYNVGQSGLVAKNNFWGAATGPGADPADPALGTCEGLGTTTVVPFATKAFKVKARINP